MGVDDQTPVARGVLGLPMADRKSVGPDAGKRPEDGLIGLSVTELGLEQEDVAGMDLLHQ